MNPLTAREKEIIGLLTRGLEDKEIAAELGTRPKTVEAQMTRIREKLDARNRVDVAVWGVRNGFAAEVVCGD